MCKSICQGKILKNLESDRSYLIEMPDGSMYRIDRSVLHKTSEHTNDIEPFQVLQYLNITVYIIWKTILMLLDQTC